MRTPWFVFIESNTSGTGRLFAGEAARQGLRPILLTDDPGRYNYVEVDRLDVLRVDTSNEAALLAACKKLASEADLAGVTSSSEYFILSAAKLAQKLGLPGPAPETIKRCRDKEFQRRCLHEAGVGIPDFAAASYVKQALAAAKRLGFPVVVKPVAGTGSAGVRLCADEKEVAVHSRALLSQRKNERGMPSRRRILIEELANGPEYSIETFGVKVIGITQKHLGPHPHFVEVGHDYPAPVSAAAQRIITRETTRAAQALELSWGPAHFELRLTSRGPKIIEANPRLAGGHIPQLVRMATGVDLIAETIRLTRGERPRLKGTRQEHASIRFILPPRDGLLMKWKGQKRASGVSGVAEVQSYAKLGTAVSVRGDFRDRIGHVIATGSSAADARATADLAGSLVQPIVATKGT